MHRVNHQDEGVLCIPASLQHILYLFVIISTCILLHAYILVVYHHQGCTML